MTFPSEAPKVEVRSPVTLHRSIENIKFTRIVVIQA